ncbi:MAG: pilus assembly protein PilP [Pseudomonadota bacterium]|jgi:type IV pilus assembly protein PilP
MSHWSGWVLFCMLAVLLGGCADARLDELAGELEQIRQAPGSQPPLVVPHIPEYQPLAYTHAEERSPFLAPEAVAGQSASVQVADANLAPDTSRESQPLERFSLQELALVGMLEMNNRQRALIRTPEGDVLSVSEGNYIGPDYGQIVRIGAKRIEIDERIFTQTRGWQVREAVLVLDGEE